MDGKAEAQRTWGSNPTGWSSAKEYKPGTREFFEKAVAFRDTHEQPWLEQIVPFHSMTGQRVLEIGFGPGFDAYKFLRSGADYIGIDITPENVERTKSHLAHYGMDPDVRIGDAEALTFPDDSFDVVYSNGVLHHIPDMAQAFREIRRVLKPGGRFYILLYNRNSFYYRVSVQAVHYATGRFLRTPLSKRRSRIEHTGVDTDVIVNLFTARELRLRLAEAGMKAKWVKTRKFTWEDLPGAGRFGRLYRAIPPSVYRAVGGLAGWYVIAEAQ